MHSRYYDFWPSYFRVAVECLYYIYIYKKHSGSPPQCAKSFASYWALPSHIASAFTRVRAISIIIRTLASCPAPVSPPVRIFPTLVCSVAAVRGLAKERTREREREREREIARVLDFWNAEYREPTRRTRPRTSTGIGKPYHRLFDRCWVSVAPYSFVPLDPRSLVRSPN